MHSKNLPASLLEAGAAVAEQSALLNMAVYAGHCPPFDTLPDILRVNQLLEAVEPARTGGAC
jgi:hypothetical protein